MNQPVEDPIVVLGGNGQGGTYVLHIHLDRTVEIAFGRFQQGIPIPVPRGDYLYVGSALATKGPSSLARRLVRHATRSDPRPPHPIRESLLQAFRQIELGTGDLLPRRGKTLFWNIDHLLDREEAGLRGVILIRSPERLESTIASMLESDPQTQVLAAGLGAHDTRETTHLFRVEMTPEWWVNWISRLRRRADPR